MGEKFLMETILLDYFEELWKASQREAKSFDLRRLVRINRVSSIQAQTLEEERNESGPF